MKRLTKQLALLTAGVLLTTGVLTGLPPTLPGAADTDTLRLFAEQLAASKESAAPSEDFCALRFSARDRQLYRDGQAVGREFGQCRVEGGQLVISTDGDNALTPQQAAEQIGCEVREENGDITVTFPFRSRRLIVKSAETPALRGGRLVAEGYRDLHVIEYDSQADAFSAYQAFSGDSSIEFVDSDRTLFAAEVRNYAGIASIDEDSKPWGVADIGADAYCTWLNSVKKELPEVHVAVVDTGVYAEHSWLQDRVLTENGACFVTGHTGGWDDDNGHGTHCSGIVAASTPDTVKILPVKVLSGEGYGSSLEIYCGMLYAVEQGADVISMSLGGDGESPLIDEGVAAVEAAGIPLCVAAGNESNDAKYHHPASAAYAITVAALDSDRQLASYSNFGSGIDFSAPGSDILSALPGAPDSLGYKNGTSMATPFVAAAAADLLSYDPTLTVDQLYAYLRANANDLGDPGFDDTYGWGEISLADFRFSEKVCPTPMFSPAPGDYDDTQLVSISCGSGDAGVTVYYTTDGSDPDPAASKKYTGEAITVNHSMILKALAVADGISSRVVTGSYCIGGMELDNPYVIKDGVLVAYNGVRSEVNLAEDPRLQDAELTKIGDRAFAGSAVKTVYLPDTVTEIGDRAFYGCTELELVSGSAAVIGKEAFRGCTRLDDLYLRPLAQIGEGAFRDCSDLGGIWAGFDEALTEIPANAFRCCYNLKNISLPDVVKIGDYAFYSCSDLNSGYERFSVAWEKLEEIGAHAFDNAEAAGCISLDSLKTLGECAFSSTKVDDVTLPEAITALPYGVFAGANMLTHLTAPGVTEIGEEALCRGYEGDLLLDIDFGGITRIGAQALYAVVMKDAVAFPALTALEPGALDGFCCPCVSLPAVEKLGTGAFSVARSIDALYFENLVSAARGAVSDACAVVVGSRFAEAEPGAFTAALLAGPENSPLSTYAANARIPYQATPSLWIRGTEYSCVQLDTLRLTAIPLGFGGLHVQWNDGDTLLYDSRTGVFFADTSEAGTFTADAVLFDGDTPLQTEHFSWRVTGDPALQTTELKIGETQIVDWRALYEAGALTPNEYGDGLTVTYQFRAETSGLYQLLVSGSSNDNSLRGTDQTNLYFYLTSGSNARRSFLAREGAVYTVRLMTYAGDIDDAGLTALRITDAPADALTELTNGNVSARWENGSLDMPTLALGSADPEITNVCYLPNDEDTVVLYEGKDYIVHYYNNGEVGDAEAMIFGIGNYYGVSSMDYEIAGKLTEGVPEKVGTIRGWSVGYFFDAEKDGDYAIYLDYSEDWLAAQKGYQEDSWNLFKSLTLYEIGSERIYLGSFDGEPAGVVLQLEGGKHYLIEVSRNSTARGAELTLCVEYGKELLRDCSPALRDYGPEDSIILQGGAAKPAFVFAEGNPKEGTDYTVQYIGNTRAGIMAVVLHGIGKYCGSSVLPLNLIGQIPESGCALIEGIEEGDYSFRYKAPVSGEYVFYTDYTPDRIESLISNNGFMYSEYSPVMDTAITVYDSSSSQLGYNDETSSRLSALRLKLTAGETYQITVTCYDPCPDATGSADAALYVSYGKRSIMNTEFIYSEYVTGSIRTDSILIWDGDDLLAEGTDYEVTLIDGNADEYRMFLIEGIGSYCGRLYGIFSYEEGGSTEDPYALTFGEEITQTGKKSVYCFSVDAISELRLRPTDSVRNDYYATIESEYDDGYWHYLDYDEQTAEVEPGSYLLTIRQNDGEPRGYVLELLRTCYSLYGCYAEAKNAYYTGSEIKPQVTVTDYRDETGEYTLTENVDYLVSCDRQLIETGLYTLHITGIGEYRGELTCTMCILPKKGEQLPALTDGDYTAEITEPGRTQLYSWSPAKGGCIVSDTIYSKNFTVYSGSKLEQIGGGIGYNYFTVDPGKNYIVAVSFVDPSQTGSIPFTVKTDYAELDLCDAEIAEAVPYDPEGAVPPFSLFDGTEQLTEGVDYEVFAVGGEQHYGKAQIILRGRGKYIGERYLDYYIYPENKEEFQDLDSYNLLLDEPTELSYGLPGTAYSLIFTAPNDGTYYLLKPGFDVSTFVYLEDGTLLPVRSRDLTLKKNETVHMLTFSNWVEPGYYEDETYTVTVSVYAPSVYWTDYENGMVTYRIEGGTAEVVDWSYDACGVSLRSEVTDPETGYSGTVTGIADTMLSFLMDRTTFYVEPGSELEDFARENGLCYAYRYPTEADKGDVTGTNGINYNDALTLQRFLTEGNGMVLQGAAVEAADVNGDGMIDMLDVREILKSHPAVG